MKFPLCISFLRVTLFLSMLCFPPSRYQLSAQMGNSSGSDASAQSPDRPTAASESQIDIPGPLRSFLRMTAATGGKAYFAKSWKDEERAFASIRNDLAHLYSLSYYPRPNPNRGWRTITVKLVGDRLKKYRIRTRDGYRPQPVQFSTATVPVPLAAPIAP